jgi:hypothetical protein
MLRSHQQDVIYSKKVVTKLIAENMRVVTFTIPCHDRLIGLRDFLMRLAYISFCCRLLSNCGAISLLRSCDFLVLFSKTRAIRAWGESLLFHPWLSLRLGALSWVSGSAWLVLRGLRMVYDGRASIETSLRGEG